MNKPEGYEEAQAFGEYETLRAGGYKCLIKEVVCQKTTNGKEYLKLAIDIAEGEFKNFFQRKFDNDTREDKKWSGTWTVFIDGYKPGTTNPKLKGLITSVEASNNGFKFNWNIENNEQALKDKKVGIVFREEGFVGTDNLIHTAIKPFYAVSYDKAEEVEIPNKKEVSDSQFDQAFDSVAASADNDNLPF